MILVAGESLIDLIVKPDGSIYPSPGGGPFNAARTMSRLGQQTRFLGRFSADPFGRRLSDRLRADNAQTAEPGIVSAPTALAVVSVSQQGVAEYWFHLAGTAGVQLTMAAALEALAAGPAALHIGSLGLVVEPMASEIEHLVAELPASTLLLLDPNCRPAAIPDADGYRARIKRILPRADIVKTSVEDLRFLTSAGESGFDWAEAARGMLVTGAGCVLVTRGPDPASAFGDGFELTEPVPLVEVADTVGAGDAFGGGFLAWWVEHGLDRDRLRSPAQVRAALRAANKVAALTCAKVGAEPPWRHELDA
jgi:fructokinase